ncbi:MAG TPA: hypothetical protein DCM32_02860 [Xanthomonadaceae bacterium]|nr:hypothetical protein [Xanthomonadaceae bacterium]
MDPLSLLLGALSGVLVGFSLGLVGGGGSILAVPLMVYVVGIDNPHVAIGTSAIAVAANAALNLANHARRGNVRWRCAAVFAAAGVVGAYGGSSLGKAVDGQALLLAFAVLMLVVGGLMLRGSGAGGDAEPRLDRGNAPRLLGFGTMAGALSGFFGIGGGFLIVPGLVAATGMSMLLAIGSSLVAVTAFGLTTALNYASSGLIDWAVAAVFIGGGLLGGLGGAALATRLSASRGALNKVFAALIFVVAAYMIHQGLLAL